MSVALYIVLERPIPSFAHSINGKALGRAGKLLDVLAEKAGTKPLMKFFSVSPGEISEFVADHGVETENETRFSPEQWFPADEGLATIRGLREAARTEKIEHLEKVLTDLDEFERVLEIAKERSRLASGSGLLNLTGRTIFPGCVIGSETE